MSTGQMAAGAMTKAERAELRSLLRRRERAAVSEAEIRSATLKADVEKKLCAIYTPDDDAAMAEVAAEMHVSIEHLNSKLAARCEQMGIPRTFAPSIVAHWLRRGDNAFAERRAELRRMAYAHIDMLHKQTVAQIQRESVRAECAIISAGLTSDSARQLLLELPTVEALMPALSVDEIKLLV